ncbi:MAG: SDR family NAD(P)-dependent oxidoreductase, partial [Bacillota bacterium]|nr:SDR family NAD(P)-dependent oxidoreductase [Bacillota bacterium]
MRDKLDNKNAMGVVCHEVVWEQAPSNHTKGAADLKPVIIFDNDMNLYNEWIERSKLGAGSAPDIILVKSGKAYKEAGNGIYEMDMRCRDHYSQLFKSLGEQNRIYGNIIHMWSRGNMNLDLNDSMEEAFNQSIYSLTFISQELMKQKIKGDVTLLYLYDRLREGGSHPCNEAAGGFVRTLRLENPKFHYKTVGIISPEGRQATDTGEILNAALNELDGSADEAEVCYHGGIRYVKALKELALGEENHSEVALKEHGVYLITGGAGGLGLVFAKYMAEEYKARVILAGRSKLGQEKEKLIRRLNKNQAEIVYIKSDISNYEETVKLVETIKDRFGEINGVIHAAGVIRDGYVLKKDPDDIHQVMAPKIYGAVNLDMALREEKLDFFVMFSSTAAVLGNPGQSDYAFANGFMDSYAALRERKCVKGARSGKTISINWPLWAEGGMQVSEAERAALYERYGIQPMPAENGIDLFKSSIRSDNLQLIVSYGLQVTLRELFLQVFSSKNPEYTGMEHVLENCDLLEETENYLKQVFEDILRIPSSKIDLDTNFQDYG